MNDILFSLAAVPEGRVFALDQQMFISILIQLFNVIILAVFLSYILYRPVSNFMRKRSDGIRQEIEKAAEAMAKALEIKSIYERKIRIIEHERAEILEAAHLLAAEKSRQILDETKRETDAAWARTTAEIQKEWERANETFRLHVIETSSAMAEKLLVYSIDSHMQERLFEETIAELGDLSWPD